MIIEKINQFIEYQNISIRNFELKISASNGLIRKAIANNTDIQAKWLTAIVDNFPQISADWLLTGKGKMLQSIETKNLQYENLLHAKDELIAQQKQTIDLLIQNLNN